MPKRTDIESILILGAGPIVIGQACEFDYSGAQACKALKGGELIGWPTDTGYALACGLYNRRGMDTLRWARGLGKHHPFTFAVSDLSSMTRYAVVEQSTFRIFTTSNITIPICFFVVCF